MPKKSAPETPIHREEIDYKIVDLVLVDDDKAFSYNLMKYLLGDKKVDYFGHPHEFKENIFRYSKDTLIYLDNTYVETAIRGIDIAQQLHELGYTRLYLLSGYTFKSSELPDYLLAIRKDEIEKLRAPLD